MFRNQLCSVYSKSSACLCLLKPQLKIALPEMSSNPPDKHYSSVSRARQRNTVHSRIAVPRRPLPPANSNAVALPRITHRLNPAHRPTASCYSSDRERRAAACLSVWLHACWVLCLCDATSLAGCAFSTQSDGLEIRISVYMSSFITDSDNWWTGHLSVAMRFYVS